MFRFVPRIAAVLLLVLAGTLAPAAAGDRPLHASGAGPAFGGGLFAWNFKATHLGRSSLTVGFDQFSAELGYFVPYGGYLISASGDRLYFEFDKEYYNIDSAGVVSATVTFTGGTGRFRTATGSANVTFSDFDPQYLQSYRFQIDGSIDY